MCTRVPTALTGGVPESSPVVLLKVAQAGLLAMVKLSASPSASPATGENV